MWTSKADTTERGQKIEFSIGNKVTKCLLMMSRMIIAQRALAGDPYFIDAL
jgi:hypothetical protein